MASLINGNFKNLLIKIMRGSTTGSVVYFAPFDQRKDSIALNELGKLRNDLCEISKFNVINENSPKQVYMVCLSNSITIKQESIEFL